MSMKWKIRNNHLAIIGSTKEDLIDFFAKFNAKTQIPDDIPKSPVQDQILAAHIETNYEVPENIQKFTRLKWLRVISNQWREAFPTMFPPTLQTLELIIRDFSVVDDFFSRIIHLRDLEKLHIRTNNLGRIRYQLNLTAYPELQEIVLEVADRIKSMNDVVMYIPADWNFSVIELETSYRYIWTRKDVDPNPRPNVPVYNQTDILSAIPLPYSKPADPVPAGNTAADKK